MVYGSTGRTRHSNRKITERYIHATRDSLTQAIDAMPDLSYPQQQLATGTDDKPGDAVSKTDAATTADAFRCSPVQQNRRLAMTQKMR